MRIHLVITFLIPACFTTPNPASCADGTCSDPSLPFCDVDATFQPDPERCIAVDCEPQQPAACRGDVLVRCNDQGNNYDLVQCERGCDPVSGCLGCANNTQCSISTPICDQTTRECRVCAIDDECDSRVCSAGTCLAEASVVYASPMGEGSECTLASPCTMLSAVSRAATTTPRPVVRLLPGIYTDDLAVDFATTLIDIVATGATIITVQATRGAQVGLRNATIVRNVGCVAVAPAPKGQLALRDVVAMDLAVNGVNCSIKIDGADTTVTGTLNFGDDVTAVFDRMSARAPTGLNMIINGRRTTVRFTNSFLENPTFQVRCLNDDCQRTLELAFSTVVLDQNQAAQVLSCPTPDGSTWSMLFENNILASFGPPPPLGGNVVTASSPSAACTFRNNVLFPQPTAIANNTSADPQFVNQAGRDYHLMPTSPAKDAAVPGTITTDHDLEGRARPQGPAPDRGAFELP